jgi:hypothetical protein
MTETVPASSAFQALDESVAHFIESAGQLGHLDEAPWRVLAVASAAKAKGRVPKVYDVQYLNGVTVSFVLAKTPDGTVSCGGWTTYQNGNIVEHTEPVTVDYSPFQELVAYQTHIWKNWFRIEIQVVIFAALSLVGIVLGGFIAFDATLLWGLIALTFMAIGVAAGRVFNRAILNLYWDKGLVEKVRILKAVTKSAEPLPEVAA